MALARIAALAAITPFCGAGGLELVRWGPFGRLWGLQVLDMLTSCAMWGVSLACGLSAVRRAVRHEAAGLGFAARVVADVQNRIPDGERDRGVGAKIVRGR